MSTPPPPRPPQASTPSSDDPSPSPAAATNVASTERGGRRNTAVLITGAGGEVGHGLIDELYNRGRRDIVALDIRELDAEYRDKCQQVVVGDICDRSVLERLLAMYEITEVYHLAALLSTRAEFTPETAHDVNVGGTLNLLRLAAEQVRSHGRRVTFLFPSSIAVYGLPDLTTKQNAGRVTEHEYCQPQTMYGCNKLYCENLGRYYARYYRLLAQDRIPNILDFRCLRFPGLISADTLPSGGTSDFGPEMLHAAAEQKRYACFVRPDTQIPFMTMPDAIKALLDLAGAPEDQLSQRVYNVTAFNPTADEIAALVRQHFPDAVIEFEPDEQRQQIVDSWPLDVDDGVARRDWSYQPIHELESAFTDYLVPRIAARYASSA